MSNLRIIKASINHLHISSGQDLFSSEELSQSVNFLPLILLLLEKTVDNKAFMDEIITFDIVYNIEALFFIEVKNINIKNESIVMNIIHEMKGVHAFLHMFKRHEHDPNRYDVERVCNYIEGQLCDVMNGDILDKSEKFDFIFDHIKTISLAEGFLMVQNEILCSQAEAQGNLPPDTFVETFALKNAYSLLNTEDKKIFDELASLACSKYLSKNPQSDIEKISNEEELDVDELLLLAAIINHKRILDKLSEYFHCQPYQVVFSDKVYALRETLKSAAPSRSFGTPSVTWHESAKKHASNLKLSKSVLKCFSASMKGNKFDVSCFVEIFIKQRKPQIKDFIKINQQGNSTIKAAIMSKKIQQKLNEKVIGQEHAVNSLCQGYLTSTIEAQQGPRSIYTFAGPSGVGKTYLASQLQSELNEFEKTGYIFNTFNMEHYTGDEDVMKLFGSGVQYVNASLGTLTSVVRAQPRQILLFDEIEKAHATVIQSLLSVLDTGLTKDRTSQEEIDFSQCIIIFTTNLGQDILQNNPQNTELSIFDLLRQSENPSNKSKLSPEFINRLAKGFPILFSELKINHLVRLAEMQINEPNLSSVKIAYNWPKNFASLMLQSMSPDISVRGLKSNLSKHKSMILNRAIPYFTEDGQEIDFQISIEESELNVEKRPIQLLLLDDDSRVFDLVKSDQQAYEISLCTDIAALPHAIESYHPDALLIDMETINKNKIPLSDVISELFERNAKMPIFTYHIVEMDNNQVEQGLSHEVREHFSLYLNDFSGAFSTMLTRVEYYLNIERKLVNMQRRNEQLQYQCKVTKQNDRYHVTYEKFSVVQLIRSIDLKGGDLFKHSLPTETLDDVIGLDRAKKRLVDVVNWLKSPEKLANFGVKLPSGFLFAGPPGTGKTFLAKALAGESGLPFFSVSSSELSGKYAGETTQNIKKLFATARKYAPAIIFIDEIDAIAGKRSSSTEGADRDRNLTVNALLTEMDGFTPQSDPVFILAATNHPQLLDSAIVRPGRFDETIYCDLPNAQARKVFFTRFSNKHEIIFTEKELAQLISSSQGMSSAEIEQVFRESIYQAIGDNKALTSENIKQTMIRVSYGLPSDHIILSKEEKCRTAYHEAGHLLLSKMLFPKQPIDFVTIEPRNGALGFVATRAADEYESLSSIRVKHRLEVLLAGRVAEKIYTGSIDEVSSGASGDIEKATQLAMHAIYEGGLDTSVGPVNISLLTKFEESDLLLKAQSAVTNWLLEAEKSVEAKLIEHRPQLDHIANTLIEKESLIGTDIDNLFL